MSQENNNSLEALSVSDGRFRTFPPIFSDTFPTTFDVNVFPNPIASLPPGSANLLVVATITAAASMTLAGLASVATRATVAASSSVLHVGACSISARTTTTTNGIIVLAGTADLQSSSTTSADGMVVLAGAADLQNSSTTSADGNVILAGTAELQDSSDVSADGSAIFAGMAELQSSSEVSASGSIIFAAEAIIETFSTIFANGTVESSVTPVAGSADIQTIATVEATGKVIRGTAKSGELVFDPYSLGLTYGISGLGKKKEEEEHNFDVREVKLILNNRIYSEIRTKKEGVKLSVIKMNISNKADTVGMKLIPNRKPIIPSINKKAVSVKATNLMINEDNPSMVVERATYGQNNYTQEQRRNLSVSIKGGWSLS